MEHMRTSKEHLNKLVSEAETLNDELCCIVLDLADALSEIENLEKENALLIRANIYSSDVTNQALELVEDLQKQNIHLKVKLNNAKKDTERLDAIECLRIGVLPGMPQSKHDYWLVREFGTNDFTHIYEKNLRNFLDKVIENAHEKL